jgi:hypothetical protein
MLIVKIFSIIEANPFHFLDIYNCFKAINKLVIDFKGKIVI